jgi:hypothetical protein
MLSPQDKKRSNSKSSDTKKPTSSSPSIVQRPEVMRNLRQLRLLVFIAVSGRFIVIFSLIYIGLETYTPAGYAISFLGCGYGSFICLFSQILVARLRVSIAATLKSPSTASTKRGASAAVAGTAVGHGSTTLVSSVAKSCGGTASVVEITSTKEHNEATSIKPKD